MTMVPHPPNRVQPSEMVGMVYANERHRTVVEIDFAHRVRCRSESRTLSGRWIAGEFIVPVHRIPRLVAMLMRAVSMAGSLPVANDPDSSVRRVATPDDAPQWLLAAHARYGGGDSK